MIKTAGTYHVSVLLNESIDGLGIQPDGVYVDTTFGGGGHSREIMRRLGAGGRLYAFDQDADAVQNSEALAAQGGTGGGRFVFVHSNFRYLSQWMRYYGEDHIDGLLADLGVSSHHFDDASRGFSFRYDAPLDMRMNQRARLTAADVLNDYDEARLADVFYLYGEMKQARRLAAAVAKARQQQRIATTGQLLQVAERVIGTERGHGAGEWPAAKDKKEVTKLFQALRIEVNREMDALRDMLLAACRLLRPGGRLSVITYHSLEDRIVKNVMRAGNAEGRLTKDFFGRVESPLRLINNKVITPTDEELLLNPRSRSAKLRVAERVGDEAQGA